MVFPAAMQNNYDRTVIVPVPHIALQWLSLCSFPGNDPASVTRRSVFANAIMKVRDGRRDKRTLQTINKGLLFTERRMSRVVGIFLHMRDRDSTFKTAALDIVAHTRSSKKDPLPLSVHGDEPHKDINKRVFRYCLPALALGCGLFSTFYRHLKPSDTYLSDLFAGAWVLDASVIARDVAPDIISRCKPPLLYIPTT